VIDVRHEVTAVFAADAVARLTGIPGVACVTAGPGLTNTITAVKNAQMAESPVVLLGGAAATVLKGRGALQVCVVILVLPPRLVTALRTSVAFRDPLCCCRTSTKCRCSSRL
jgi:acetolactate synthase-like protein